MSRGPARRHHPKPARATELVAIAAIVVGAVLISLGPAGAVPAQKASTTTTPVTTKTTQKAAVSTNPPTSATTATTFAATATTVAASTGSTAPPTSAGDATTSATLADAGGVQPFPAPLVAPVPAAEVPVERLMTNVYATASTDPDRPQVVVQFKSPFALPSRPYRVSVLVGDPAGAKLRSSMVGNGAGVVSWKVEKAPAPPPGAAWTTPPVWTTVDTNDAGASFSAAGLAVVTVPLKDAPEGPAVWAEVETGSDGKQLSTSPFYSRPAMFGEVATPGQLPSSTVGAVINTDGTPSGQYVSLPAGPVLSLEDQSIALRSTERPPTQLAGQNVEKAYDFIRVAPTFNKRAVVTDYIFIDRSSGEVKLLDGFTVPPGDKSNGAPWVTSGLPPGDASAPGTLVFGLKGVAQNLGIEMSANATGFGLRREYLLADGRHVVAEAVLGTVGWFGAEAIAGLDQPATSEGPPIGPMLDADASDTASKVGLVVALVAGALLLVVAAAIVVVRRRRQKIRGDAADQLDLIAVETAQHRAVLREERRATGQVPVVVIDPGAEVESGPTPARAGVSVEAVPSEPDVAGVEADPGPTRETVQPEPEPERVAVTGAPDPVGPRPAWATGSMPVIDAAPIWADDARISGERPVISAPEVRSVTGAAAHRTDEAVAGPPTAGDEQAAKLKSTFGGSPPTDSSSLLQPIAPRRSPRVAPEQALESLGAEFDELTRRLEKLGGASPATGEPEVSDVGAARH